MGHSAGAHLAAQFLVKKALFGTSQRDATDLYGPSQFGAHQGVDISGFIGLCGVYNIAEHYLHESKRGL